MYSGSLTNHYVDYDYVVLRSRFNVLNSFFWYVSFWSFMAGTINCHIFVIDSTTCTVCVLLYLQMLKFKSIL